MNWLVTGGAGYIGSHVARDFSESGHNVVVLDNLDNGIRGRLPKDLIFFKGDCSDSKLVSRLLLDFKIQGIVHLAAFKQARESQRAPLRYWSNNIESLMGVLRAIKNSDVRHFIQSSSCSIYGSQINVNENSEIRPQSTYARTKSVAEMILKDVVEELKFSVTSLRYFNVIGCGSFPLAHDVSNECIVPSFSRKIKDGLPVSIFGNKLDTPDGTCYRDYLDVRDLSSAHLIAANNSTESIQFQSWNVSSGLPVSALEIADNLIRAFGAKNHPIQFLNANPADPAEVWAKPSMALSLLGWRAKYSLEDSLDAHVRSWEAKAVDY